MRQIGFIFTLLLLIVSGSVDAQAATKTAMWKGLKVTCSGSAFAVEETYLKSKKRPPAAVKEGPNTNTYYDINNANFFCELGDIGLVAFIKETPRSNSSTCRKGLSDISLTLSMNDILILEDQRIGHECFSTLSDLKVSIEKIKDGHVLRAHLLLEFCGRGSTRSKGLSKGSGCSKYFWDWLRHRKLPLNLKNAFSPYIPERLSGKERNGPLKG